MDKKLKKRLKNTLFATVLFFAFIHIAILLIFTAISGKLETINIFNILDLNLFLAGIGYGFISQLLSVFLVLTVGLIVFLLLGD